MLYKCCGLCLVQLNPHSVHPLGKDYSHNHISDLLEQLNHQSKQTLLHFRRPSTHHSLVAINRLFPPEFLLLFKPKFSEHQFLKRVNYDKYLSVVEAFV